MLHHYMTADFTTDTEDYEMTMVIKNQFVTYCSKVELQH